MKHPGSLFTRIAVVLLFISSLVHAQTYTVLSIYPETSSNDTGVLAQILAQGRDANLYSTIATGGAHNDSGSAYQMTTAGQLTTIYNFCSLSPCTDGANPFGGLTLGFDGNFYGTTQGGGKDGAGTIVKLIPGTTWTEQTPYYFTNGKDDSAPTFTLLQGQDGNFYGVSEEQYNGQYGAFFKVSASGQLTVLHDFTFTDGATPNLPTQGTDGNFYGTAYLGGSANLGVVYKLTPSGAITVLHNFVGYASGDGSYPEGVLVQANDGYFYGVTREGGTSNEGTVFKINSTGSSYTVLHSFDYTSQTLDGAYPATGLGVGTDSNLYGTTTLGGNLHNGGAIFEITPAGQETILYRFCALTGCTDGFYPYGPIMQHTNGTFYGTTTGNSLGGGVFYSLGTGLRPFVRLLNWEGKVGATIEILGQGFTSATQVSFNGTTAAFTSVSNNYLTAVVPAGATTGYLTVTTSSGTMKSSKQFLVTPQILSLSQLSGPVGTQVTITGVSLTQAEGVGFGDYVPAKFTVNSDTSVTATVPVGAKSGPVGVLTPGGTAISSQVFKVTPNVASFTPAQGPVGQQVQIFGNNFTGTNQVTFGGVAATSFHVASDKEVDAVVPTGAITGPIAVTTPSGTGTSTTNFVVTQ